MDNKYTFYNQDIAMRGRLMDVCLNFMICADRVTETLPDDVKHSVRTECSDLMQKLADIADDVWPIPSKRKRIRK